MLKKISIFIFLLVQASSCNAAAPWTILKDATCNFFKRITDAGIDPTTQLQGYVAQTRNFSDILQSSDRWDIDSWMAFLHERMRLVRSMELPTRASDIEADVAASWQKEFGQDWFLKYREYLGMARSRMEANYLSCIQNPHDSMQLNQIGRMYLHLQEHIGQDSCMEFNREAILRRLDGLNDSFKTIFQQFLKSHKFAGICCVGLLALRFYGIGKLITSMENSTIRKVKQNPKYFANNNLTIEGVRKLAEISSYYTKIKSFLNIITSVAFTYCFYAKLKLHECVSLEFAFMANYINMYVALFLIVFDTYHFLNDTLSISVDEALERFKEMQAMANLTEGVQIINHKKIKQSVDDLVLPKAVKDFTEDVLYPFFKQKESLSKGCGALFYGTPGTGKTTYALACAKKLGLSVIFVTTASLLGGSATQQMSTSNLAVKKIEALFDKAKSMAPCIIILDEIEVLTRRRDFEDKDSSSSIATNALLSALDKCFNFPQEKRVFVIGTTNSALTNHDEAIIRPGRLRDAIIFDNPGTTVRKDLIRLFLNKYLPSSSIQDIEKAVDLITPCTENSSPTEVEAILKGLASKSSCSSLTKELILETILEVKSGKIDSDLKKDIGTATTRKVAISKAGSIVSGLLNIKNVSKVFKYASIEPRISGQDNGVLFSKPKFIVNTKADLEAFIAMYFGGEIAEQIMFPEDGHSTANEANYKKIYEIIEKMCSLGMLEGVTSKSASKIKGQAIDLKLIQIKDKVRSQLSQEESITAIKAVAKVLVDNGTVDSSKIFELPEVQCLKMDL